MRTTAASLILAISVISSCAPGFNKGSRVDSESGWRCTPLPPDFQEADLIGTWELLRPQSETLILWGDGTCQHTYGKKNPDQYECAWHLEERWGGLYLHIRGMHYCIGTDSVCEQPGGGGGDWLYYDFCSGRVLEMPNEVILSVHGAHENLEKVYGPVPRGIVLRHMQADPDSGMDLLILRK